MDQRHRGRVDEATRSVEEALSQLQRCDADEPQLTGAYRVAADELLFAGHLDRAEALVEQALKHAGPEPSTDLGWAVFTRARVHNYRGQHAEARAGAERARHLGTLIGDQLLMALAANLAGDSAGRQGDHEAAASAYEQALAWLRGVDQDEACMVELNLALLNLQQERWEDVRSRMDGLRPDPRVRRLILAQLAVAQMTAAAAAGLGDWWTCRAALDEVETLAAAAPHLADPDLAYVMDITADLATGAGRSSEAARARALATGFGARLSPT